MRLLGLITFVSCSPRTMYGRSRVQRRSCSTGGGGGCVWDVHLEIYSIVGEGLNQIPSQYDFRAFQYDTDADSTCIHSGCLGTESSKETSPTSPLQAEDNCSPMQDFQPFWSMYIDSLTTWDYPLLSMKQQHQSLSQMQSQRPRYFQDLCFNDHVVILEYRWQMFIIICIL